MTTCDHSHAPKKNKNMYLKLKLQQFSRIFLKNLLQNRQQGVETALGKSDEC